MCALCLRYQVKHAQSCIVLKLLNEQVSKSVFIVMQVNVSGPSTEAVESVFYCVARCKRFYTEINRILC